ncbi:MAG: hypothetical protein K8T91_23865 [Planctomycetes bacterium]|nr:hypothetical protein [Planctomycetota bacterium]
MEPHAPEIVKKKKPSPPFEILSINKTAATAVSLPDMAPGAIVAASLDMTVLGTVNFEPAQITLSLLGGEVASHELGTFHLQSSPTKTQPFRWLARYQNPAGQTAPIAEFVLSDRQLKFGWRAESKAHEEAHCLRNCLLKLAVGEKAQPVALRTPLGGKHLKLGLKNKTNEAYTIPWLPKGGRMKLELLLDNIELPSHEISRKVLNIESDRSALTFSSAGQLLLEVKIRIEMDNTLLIAAVAQWTPPGGEPRVFDGAALSKQRARLLKKLSVVVDSTQRDEIVAASEGIAELLNLAETIEAAGSLPFRVVMNVDGYEVVVLQSDQEASAETRQIPGPAE